MEGTLGALLPHLAAPTSYQQANKEGVSVLKAEGEDDEAEEERKIKKREKQTGRTLYLALELSPSVFLS